MVALPRVRGGVLVRGVIAAADLAALEADPQVEPGIADLQALLAPLDRLRELGDSDLI
jgi:hypothetical protein